MMQKKHNPTVIAYNTTDDLSPDKRGFSIVGKVPPGGYLIKDSFLPGLFGYKDVYIRRIPADDGKLLIISYTHTEPSEAERQQIAEQAVQWLKDQQ